jgi:hypothetical protein
VIVIPRENKRELADVPDDVLNRLLPVVSTDLIHPATPAMEQE